jgi:hypothetical protein
MRNLYGEFGMSVALSLYRAKTVTRTVTWTFLGFYAQAMIAG